MIGQTPIRRSRIEKDRGQRTPDLFSTFLYETFLTSNFGLFENTPTAFIFEIEVKGPHRLILSQNQYTPLSRGK